MRIHPLLFAACMAALCQAEDITLTDGTVLQEACVLRQDDESATIRHSTGVQRIPYQRLPHELQTRLGLTPEAVAARREQQREDARKRAEAREKKAAQQRAALEESGRHPRYMTGADVISLYSTWGTLSAATAEYLAAEWNRREALRCGLTVEAAGYKENAAALARHIEQERAEAQREQQRVATVEQQLRQAQQELKLTQDKLHALEKKYNEQEKQPTHSTTTVVVSEPRYVPVYQPAPVVVPPPPRPVTPPPVVRPAPQVKPFHPGSNSGRIHPLR